MAGIRRGRHQAGPVPGGCPPPIPQSLPVAAPPAGSCVVGISEVMETDLPICATCGVQYGAERADCPICLDERQYVGWDGQQWTTLARLAGEGHRGLVRDEGPGVTGIGADPPTAIGQRALLVRAPGGNVLFDMITYIDDDLVARVRALGGISAIAISHPHFYGSKFVMCGNEHPVTCHKINMPLTCEDDCCTPHSRS